MGFFHYKAEFIKQEKNYVFYRFYPDYFAYETIFGEFQIKLENWRTAIISEAEINGLDTFHCNDRPVGALTYKIKKYFEENRGFPETAYHIS